MSEELTVTVRQEVGLILNNALADTYAGVEKIISLGEIPGSREFYESVLEELRGVVEGYARSGEPTETEPEPEPQQIEVGDLVELTGKSWGDVKSPKIGELYVVASVTEEDGSTFYDSNGDVWYVFENDQVEWGAKVHKKASEL